MQGGAIQANVQLWDIRQFDAKLHENCCYRFEAYGCKKIDRWQRTLENDITLLFGKYTHATEIADIGFPKHYFKFAAYNQIGQRADARDSILTGTLRHEYKAPAYTTIDIHIFVADYIGILRDVHTVRESGDSMTNRISCRNVDIQNLKYVSIQMQYKHNFFYTKCYKQ